MKQTASKLAKLTPTAMFALSLLGTTTMQSPRMAFAEQNAAATERRPGDELLGEWWTEDNEGRVSFARYKDGTYRGTTTCCSNHEDAADSPLIDRHNPDPKLRNRSTVGIVLIWNLHFQGDGDFTDGHVYNPRDGKTYRMKIHVVDRGTIEVRGYMGIPLLGQTQVWKRVKSKSQAK